MSTTASPPLLQPSPASYQPSSQGRRRFALLLVVVDLFVFAVSLNLAAMTRGAIEWGDPLVTALLAPLCILVFGFLLIDGYNRRTDMLSLDYGSQHVLAGVVAAFGAVLVAFVVFPPGHPLQLSRASLALAFALTVPVSLFVRRAVYLRIRNLNLLTPLLFAGRASHCAEFAAECRRIHFARPVRYANTDYADAPDSFAAALRDIASGTLHVEAIVLRETRHDLPEDVTDLLLQLYGRGVPTYTLEFFQEAYWRKTPLHRLNQNWLFQEGFRIARDPVFERLKRLSDILLALIGLVFAAPLILAAAFAIRLDGPGPVLFRQNRIGRNQVPFPLYKLRTMLPSCAGSRYTSENDARITRVGRFLRTSRLDELPQLWNVLRGDMSLIGPRAEWDELVRDYERAIPFYHFRHLLRPGITGWAQINYPYGANLDDTTRKLEYDLYYVRHFSFLLDARIILKTVHVMLFRKGGR